MKLSWETIRRILVATDDLPGTAGQLATAPGVLGDNIYYYHTRLLIEAGLLDGICQDDLCLVRRLTWEGHELLAQLRSPLWERIKDLAREKGVALTLDNIAMLAKESSGGDVLTDGRPRC